MRFKSHILSERMRSTDSDRNVLSLPKCSEKGR